MDEAASSGHAGATPGTGDPHTVTVHAGRVTINRSRGFPVSSTLTPAGRRWMMARRQQPKTALRHRISRPPRPVSPADAAGPGSARGRGRTRSAPADADAGLPGGQEIPAAGDRDVGRVRT